MSRDALLAMLRRDEAELMRSTVRIETVEETWDDSTGTYTESVTATHYNGKALIIPEPDRLQEVEVGQGQAGMALTRVTVEQDTDVPRNARVTVTESPDPALVGRELWVFDYDLSDRQLNRVLICRETR